MNNYAHIALLSIEKITCSSLEPLLAWKLSAAEVFPINKDSRDKSCPKCAFLGLCEDGLVKGVNVGNYTTSVDNKNYALKGLELLKNDSKLSTSELWKIVNPSGKASNNQMDIVKVLFEEGYLIY